MMTQQEGFFQGHDGTDLFFQSWVVPEARAAVLVTHGHGEHSEWYERLAAALIAANINVLAWDLRGHGRSEGQRGYAKHFNDFILDQQHFVKEMESQLEEKPYYLLGHSMGGLILLRSVLSGGPSGARALLLSSPLLGLSLKVPAWKEKIAELAGQWLPKLTLHNEISESVLTHDSEILKKYPTDPYRHNKISSAVFLGILEQSRYVIDHAGEFTTPLLLQMSGQDRVVDADQSAAFFDRYGSEKTKFVYKNSYHEIYNDLERTQVFEDLIQFIDKDLK